MAALSEDVQAFIVQAHACFRKPSLIIKDVNAEFGITITRQQVQRYHPERCGRKQRLAERWKVLFAETRKALVDKKVEVGIAHLNYRLLLYQRAAEFYEEKGNLVLAAAMAERAARDDGGAYTNRHELTGKGGEPLVPPDITAALLKVYGSDGSENSKNSVGGRDGGEDGDG